MNYQTKQQLADAMQSTLGFVTAQTTHIEAGVYAHRYPELDYASLIPVDTSAPEWIKSVTYFSMDSAGQAGWINGNADDIPMVGFQMSKSETAVHMAAIGYSYGYEEANQASLLGVPLDSTKALAARRAYEQMVYRVAFSGDTEKGFEGLFNYTGVPVAAAAATGTGSSALWSAKTEDQILADVNASLLAVHTQTETVEMADTVILPVERLMSIASMRLGDTSMTVLEFLQKNNVYTATTGQPLSIRSKRGLLTAGAGGTARMMAYRRSPDVLKLHIPMPHRFLPVQQHNLQFNVPGIFRLGGLDFRLKKAARYTDGI